jgi:hypothetical protein
MTDEDLDAVVELARRESRPPRVLVTGSREWADPEPIRRALKRLPTDTILIHGMARGADRLAHEVAEELGLEIRPCPAEWEKYGKAAGIIRNRQMLAEDKPDLVLAFHPNLAEARGTKHMVEVARKAGVPVEIIEG